MYHFSVCSIIRNEANYLPEWLEFNKLQGVEHIYLYDNDSNDNTHKILKPYIDSGFVTLTVWHGRGVQLGAYTHALSLYKYATEWVAFIDVDEFLWSPAVEKVSALLEGMDKDVAGVAAHWVLFGCNGKIKKEDGLVIERFTMRSKNINGHVKSIVRPRLIASIGKNPHTFIPIERCKIINESAVEVKGNYAIIDGGTADYFRINHYHTKSKNEYFERRLAKPRPDIVREFNLEEVSASFMAHDCNEEEDTRIRDLYAGKIKECLKL